MRVHAHADMRVHTHTHTSKSSPKVMMVISINGIKQVKIRGNFSGGVAVRTNADPQHGA